MKIIRVDHENNAETFFNALQQKFPQIAKELEKGWTVVSKETLSKIEDLEGFIDDDAPEYAPTPLLIEDVDFETFARAIRRLNMPFSTAMEQQYKEFKQFGKLFFVDTGNNGSDELIFAPSADTAQAAVEDFYAEEEDPSARIIAVHDYTEALASEIHDVLVEEEA